MLPEEQPRKQIVTQSPSSSLVSYCPARTVNSISPFSCLVYSSASSLQLSTSLCTQPGQFSFYTPVPLSPCPLAHIWGISDEWCLLSSPKPATIWTGLSRGEKGYISLSYFAVQLSKGCEHTFSFVHARTCIQ